MVRLVHSDGLAARKRDVAALSEQADKTPGLCIPCAVAHLHFTERAPVRTASMTEKVPAAWINGRGYRLLRHPAFKATCIQCGQTVCMAYSPTISSSKDRGTPSVSSSYRNCKNFLWCIDYPLKSALPARGGRADLLLHLMDEPPARRMPRPPQLSCVFASQGTRGRGGITFEVRPSYYL